MKECFLVAEIGINHNGDLKIAKQLIYEFHTSEVLTLSLFY